MARARDRSIYMYCAKAPEVVRSRCMYMYMYVLGQFSSGISNSDHYLTSVNPFICSNILREAL